MARAKGNGQSHQGVAAKRVITLAEVDALHMAMGTYLPRVCEYCKAQESNEVTVRFRKPADCDLCTECWNDWQISARKGN